MNEVLEKIQKIGIVPVVVLDDAKDAAPLAKALCEGGLPCAEVTFRTAAAEESIRIMAKEFPDMLVGAGTVLTTEQVDRAVNAGAKFIVSPGLNPTVVKYCVDKGIPVTPGTSNPSDVEMAISLGLDVVKFFPAEQAGGINMIKAMAAPYTQMKFMPTGGINAKNINSYLAFDKILACGGSWMVKKDLVAAGEFDKIRDLTKEAVQTMLGFRIGPYRHQLRERGAGRPDSLCLRRPLRLHKEVRKQLRICRNSRRMYESAGPWRKGPHRSFHQLRCACEKLSGNDGL